MLLTEEQDRQAQALLLEQLNLHHQHRIPFREVWTKLDEDLDQVPFLEIWAIYGGDQIRLDPGALNEFDIVIAEPLKNIGIHAIPSIHYVHDSEAHLLGNPWTR